MKKMFSVVSGIALCMGLMAGNASAINDLSVDATAAMAGTNYGLHVTLEAGQTNQAWVMAGPDKGFSNETTLNGSFFIGPQDLTINRGQYFQFLTFLQGFGANSNVKLIFFMHRELPVNGDYFISVWHYNSNVSNWVFTGNGFFAQDGNPFFATTKIDFSYTIGNPGTLTMWRTLYHDGTPDPSGQIQMFSVPVAGQAGAAINYVFAGMFNKNTHPTIAGDFYLDEFVFTR